MKREADQLRTTVRELVDELAERKPSKMAANEYLITCHQNRIVSFRLFVRAPGEDLARQMNVNVQEACEIAAWLVISAGLSEQMSLDEARAYFDGALKEALEA